MSRQDRRDIVLFSTADWYAKYWTNKQHVASPFAARGHRVLYVETVGLRQPGLNRRGLHPSLEPLTISVPQTQWRRSHTAVSRTAREETYDALSGARTRTWP